MNEELRRHRDKIDDRQCKLCGDECESVVHVLWESPVYDSILHKLFGGGGGSFKEFSLLV